MGQFCKVNIKGFLGKDPEFRTSASGKKYCAFPVAVTKKYKEQETTSWFYCKAWGNFATIVDRCHIVKGSAVFVTGTLEIYRWTDNDGNAQQTPQITIDSIEKLDREAAPAKETDNQPQRSEADDDLPF